MPLALKSCPRMVSALFKSVAPCSARMSLGLIKKAWALAGLGKRRDALAALKRATRLPEYDALYKRAIKLPEDADLLPLFRGEGSTEAPAEKPSEGDGRRYLVYGLLVLVSGVKSTYAPGESVHLNLMVNNQSAGYVQVRLRTKLLARRDRRRRNKRERARTGRELRGNGDQGRGGHRGHPTD